MSGKTSPKTSPFSVEDILGSKPTAENCCSCRSPACCDSSAPKQLQIAVRAPRASCAEFDSCDDSGSNSEQLLVEGRQNHQLLKPEVFSRSAGDAGEVVCDNTVVNETTPWLMLQDQHHQQIINCCCSHQHSHPLCHQQSTTIDQHLCQQHLPYSSQFPYVRSLIDLEMVFKHYTVYRSIFRISSQVQCSLSENRSA